MLKYFFLLLWISPSFAFASESIDLSAKDIEKITGRISYATTSKQASSYIGQYTKISSKQLPSDRLEREKISQAWIDGALIYQYKILDVSHNFLPDLVKVENLYLRAINACGADIFATNPHFANYQRCIHQKILLSSSCQLNHVKECDEKIAEINKKSSLSSEDQADITRYNYIKEYYRGEDLKKTRAPSTVKSVATAPISRPKEISLSGSEEQIPQIKDLHDIKTFCQKEISRLFPQTAPIPSPTPDNDEKGDFESLPYLDDIDFDAALAALAAMPAPQKRTHDISEQEGSRKKSRIDSDEQELPLPLDGLQEFPPNLLDSDETDFDDF